MSASQEVRVFPSKDGQDVGDDDDEVELVQEEGRQVRGTFLHFVREGMRSFSKVLSAQGR